MPISDLMSAMTQSGHRPNDRVYGVRTKPELISRRWKARIWLRGSATEIPALTRHHQPLALLLRRRERKPGRLQHYRPDIGDIERVVGW